MSYRDDRDADRGRIAALEAELMRAKRETERVKAQRDDLITELQRARHPSTEPPTALAMRAPDPLTTTELAGLVAELEHAAKRHYRGLKASLVMGLLIIFASMAAVLAASHGDPLVRNMALVLVGTTVLAVIAGLGHAGPQTFARVLEALRSSPAQITEVRRRRSGDLFSKRDGIEIRAGRHRLLAEVDDIDRLRADLARHLPHLYIRRPGRPR